MFYQNLAYIIHRKILKSHTKIMNLKYQLRYGTQNLNYLMDHILYLIFKVILNIPKEIMEKRLIIF